MGKVSHYTLTKARKEIGKSKSWALARKTSIKKWEEIDKYGEDYYEAGEACGFCMVLNNRGIGICYECPAKRICNDRDWASPKAIIKRLRKLKLRGKK